MARYTLSVPQYHIESTRSRGADTLFASKGLVVLNANGSLHKAWDSSTISLGNQEDKVTLPLNIPYLQVDVPDPTPENPDGGSINWVFMMTNSGSARQGFIGAANKVMDTFAGGAAGKVFDGASNGAVFVVALASSLVLLAGEEILSFMTADCDGVVVGASLNFTAAELLDMTARSNPWTRSDHNVGSQSPSGCGDNSKYDVTYNIEQTMPFDNMQGDWASCSKCHSLFFKLQKGACPEGGQHDPSESFMYSTIFNEQSVTNLQDGWRSCKKCQCLHFSITAPCAGGGQHDDSGSFDYKVRSGILPSSQVQEGWASCSKCRTLYFLAQGGACPGGGQHDATGSLNYLVDNLPFFVAPISL